MRRIPIRIAAPMHPGRDKHRAFGYQPYPNVWLIGWTNLVRGELSDEWEAAMQTSVFASCSQHSATFDGRSQCRVKPQSLLDLPKFLWVKANHNRSSRAVHVQQPDNLASKRAGNSMWATIRIIEQ